MRAVVIVLLVVVVVVIVSALVATLTAFGRARRANRVVPGADTGAPLHWLMSPSATARLHRRLRSAVLLAGTVGGPPVRRRWLRRRKHGDETALGALARKLEGHAVAIDRDLVLASRLRGSTRRAVLDPAARQVAAVERLATRLAATARADAHRALAPAPAAGSLDQFDDELRALEAARDEIADIEARVTSPQLRL